MRQMHVIFIDDSVAAGLAIGMDDGFHFYAANEIFRKLERGRYKTVAEISQQANLTAQRQQTQLLNS